MKKKLPQKVTATPAQLSAAFTEWLRRWQENPNTTREHTLALLTESPRTYGEEVTPYFIELLGELKAQQS